MLFNCLSVSSVAQSCLTLCNPMNRSTPGLPVHHQLPQFAQTHLHWVSDAIQPSHPVIPFSFCLQSFPASGSFPMSQFFTSGGQSIGVSASASVLSTNISSLGGHVFPFQLLWAKCPYQKHVRNIFTWPSYDPDPQQHSSKCDTWL